MSNWTEERLGDICSIQTGNKNVNEGSKEGEYLFFTCAQEVYKINQYSFDGEAILIAGNGFFNVKYYNGKFDAYQRTYVLMNFKAFGKFLYQYIKYKLNDITSDSRGSTIKYIRVGDLENYNIPLPPTLEEQEQVVQWLESRLEKLNNARTKLTKIPLILKKFRQSVLSSACSGKLTATWREANGVGFDWEEKILKDVCTKFQYGSSKKSEKQGKVPVLRMGNIQNSKICFKDLVFSSDDMEIKKFTLSYGDVLFNRTNSPELVGKTAIYESTEPAIFAGYLIKIHNDKSLLNSWFLNYILNTLEAKEFCQNVKSDGVSQSNINAQKLANFKFLLPPLEEQEEIVRIVDKLMHIADTIEQRYNLIKSKLDKTEKTLYKKAFGG